MKILILAVHYEVTGARYIADAFTRLGHDVIHTGPEARLKDAWGVDVQEKYIWKPDVISDDWTPDLIVIADTNTPDYAVPTKFHHVPVVVWSNDNHVKNLKHLNFNYNGLVKHWFLAHYHGKAQPVTYDDETWLPCATDPIAFPPSPIAWNDREYDFCCIGVMYPDRARRVQLLKDAGYKVFAATGLVYDEYRDAYQNSRIALCSSVAGDLAQRFFEGAGMGCLVLTDLLDDLVDPETRGKLGVAGFACYNNDKELLFWANELLRNPDEQFTGVGNARTLQEIVLKGYRTVGDECMKAGGGASHTWESRCKVVIDYYNKYHT